MDLTQTPEATDRLVQTVDLTAVEPAPVASAWDKPVLNGGSLARMGAYALIQSDDPNEFDAVFTEIKERAESFPVSNVVQEMAAKVDKSEKAILEGALDRYARAGDVATTASLVQGLAAFDNRPALDNPQAAASVSKAAIEKMIVNNDRVLKNNTPEQINRAVDSIGEGYAWNMFLDYLSESYRPSGVDWAKSIGRDILPFAAQFSAYGRVPSLYKAFTGNDNTLYGKDILEDLQNKLSVMSIADKKQFVSGLVKTFKDSNFVTNVDVSQFVSNLVSGLSYETANLQEGLDTAFTLIDSTAMSGVVRWMRSRSLAKTLAETGNKSVVSDAVAKSLMDGTEKQVAKELGITVDEAKSMGFSFDPKQFVPHGIEGAAADVQKRLIAVTEDLITKLSDTLRTSGKTQPEIEEALARIRKQYDPNVNPRVVSVDFSPPREEGLQSVVVWQGRTGKPFATMEEAKAWADRQGMTGYEIIPAKSQPSATVAEEVTKPHASIVSGIFAKVRPETRDPWIDALNKEVHKDLRGVGEEAFVMFKIGDDQAIKEDVLGQLRQIIAEAQLRGDRRTVEDALAAERLLGELEDVMRDYGGVFKLPPQYAVDTFGIDYKLVSLFEKMHSNPVFEQGIYTPLFKRFINSKLPSARKETFTKDVLPNLSQLPYAPNIRISKNLSEEIGTFVSDFAKVLGMQNQHIVIMTEVDVAKLKNLSGVAGDTIAYGMRDPHTNAFWFPYRDMHIIGIKNRAGSGQVFSEVEKIENLAHEFGHAFHYTWADKYNKPLAETFAQWLYKRGILSPTDLDNLYLDNFTKFIEDFRAVLSGTRQLRTINKGGIQSMSELGGSSWYSAYSEFFAENFAKWTLSEKLPVSLLEKAWKEIADAIVSMFSILAKYGRKVFGADFTVAKLLNDHVVGVKQGQILPAQTRFAQGPVSGKVIDSERVWEDLLPGKVFEEDIGDLIDINNYLSRSASHEELSSGWYVRQRRIDPLSLDVVGRYSEQDIDSMHVLLGYVDPKHGASELLVEQRVIGVHAEAKMRRALADFVKEPYDKLSGKEKQQVLGVLTKGDAYSDAGGVGKEFHAHELLAEGLNSKQMEAYFATRTARNVMHQMRDQAMVRSLRSKGFSKVEIGFADGTTFTSAGKRIPFEEVKGKAAYDAHTQERVYLTPKVIEDYERSGFFVVETMESHTPTVGRDFTRFVVRPSKTQFKEIQTVIPFRPGEFARIYTDEYFIARNIRKSVNDEKTKTNEHMHTASTAKDAKAYVEGMNRVLRMYGNGATPVDTNELSRLIGQWEDVSAVKKDIENGLWKDIEEFNWHFNRMQDDYIRDYTGAEASAGRLFTDKRGSKLAPIDDRDRENTMSVMDSIQAEVTNSARVVSLTEWKDAAIRRWYNTFKEVLPQEQRYMRPEQAFFAMEGKTYVGTAKQNLFAERTYKYVMQQLGAKTKEDKLFEGLSRAITERIFTGKIETIGQKLRASEPIAFLRTVNFHAMLGSFNPAQLFVQANGAATAVILHPVHGLRAAYTAPLLRIALMSDNPEVWRTLANTEKLATLGMSNVQEFEDTVRAIRRSGIIDGINSTSLYNVEDGRFNIFSPTLRKVKEGSAFFFNRGEEFSRLISFDVARREWIKTHPDVDWTTTEALREIVVRQDDLTQNMTRANQAGFQRGLLSIPFQFLQYNIKLGANLFGAIGSKVAGKPYRGFTAQEAATLMLGHLALYGLANNGLGTIVEEIIGEQTAEMSEDQRLFLTQGIVAGVINETGKALTGEQVQLAVGKRLATFDWYGNIAKALVDNDARTMETLMGPSYSILAGMGVIGDVAKIWWHNPDLSTEDVVDGLRRITVENITTLKNIDKAYIAYNHGYKIQTRAGADNARVNQYELFAQAIGMPSAEVADLEKLMANKKSHFETLTRLAKLINEQQVAYVTALNRGDSKRAESILKTIQALYPVNSGDMDFILRETKDQVYPFDTRLEKEIARYLQSKQFGMKEPLITNRDPNVNKVTPNGAR